MKGNWGPIGIFAWATDIVCRFNINAPWEGAPNVKAEHPTQLLKLNKP